MTSATDPRFARSRQAILDASRELLLSAGPVAVTHARVAERAGVGRATVYRHWPRAHQLLAEAMAATPMPFFRQPTVPIRDWLRRELTTMARQLELDDVRAVATTLASSALWDDELDQRRSQYAAALTRRLASALEDAHARGELELAIPADNAAAVLIGPVYYCATIEHESIAAAIIEAAIGALGVWSSERPGDR